MNITAERCAQFSISFRLMALGALLALWLVGSGQVCLNAATLPGGFSEAVVNGPPGGGWSEPVGMHFEANGRMYVWEKAGRVWFQESGTSTWTQLIDLSQEVGNWGDYGLLGFALDPNFRVNGYLYLMYVVDRHHLMNFGTGSYNPTANDYNSATIGRITRYTASATNGFSSVDLASRFILLGENRSNGIPILYSSHGVGTLVFGDDGTLLVSCGEGASWSSVDVGSAAETYYSQGLSSGIIRSKENVGAYRAQMIDSLSGKILRLDPATGNGIPGNPFYDAANPRAARSRVWALGLRNPYRMTLRPGTGSHVVADANPGVLYIGDVGYSTWEELNVCTGPGQNFGWPAFEGVEVHSGYYNANVANQDAPNPLYPGAGCAQYFYFNNLVKQDTTVVANQPPFNNPCNAGQKIPGTVPQFLQTPPALDWKHGVTQARTWVYNGSGVAVATNIGTSGSPVSGSMFPGNSSIGGVWYTGSDFPAQYQNTYFHAEYGANWIKAFVFNANEKPVSVGGFLTGGGGIVALATHPVSGGLYYIDINSSTVRKVTYSVNGNLPPTAVVAADQNYGPTPLTVQLTGSGSSDPEGLPLSYRWNFGDGTAVSTNANPSHTFNASVGVPTLYTVSLTVTDSVGQVSTTTLPVSVNNTPPTVNLTSPTHGAKYSMASNTILNLTATVADVESPDAQLKYEWRTFLEHNNHFHQEALDTNHVTTTLIDPVGCDGINIYYYRLELTVRDPHGLVTVRSASIFPDCGAVDTPPVISAIPNQTINQNQSSAPIVFSVSDAETASANLQVSGFSSNPTLVPPNKIIFGDNGINRTVTVTPAAGQSGTAVITVTANDGPNNTSTNFLVTVQAVPLGITTTTLPNGAVNLAYAATLTGSGGVAPYTWSLAGGSLPAGLTLNTNTGGIGGTPTTAGTAVFAARLTDAGNPVQIVTQALSLTITLTPPQVVIGNTNNSTLSDYMWASGAYINASRFQATASATVAALQARVTAIAGKYKCAIYSESNSLPGRLLRSTAEVSNPGGGWQNFPLSAPQALTNGSYYWLAIWSDDANAQVYYSDASGTLRWRQTNYGTWPDLLTTTGGGNFKYNIYATSATATPGAGDLAVGLLEDTTTNLTLVGQGGAGALSYAILSNPTNGNLGVLNTNTGIVSYTPVTNYFGSDYFRYTVSDGSQQATGTVSLTIIAVNDAPIAFSQSVTNAEEVSFAITLTALDVDGPVTNFVVVSNPSFGVLSGTPPNLTYRSNTNYYGPDSFTFRVNDGSLTSAVATVTITLTNVNDAPLSQDDDYSLGNGAVLEVAAPGVLSNDSDVEGESLSAVLVNGPAQGSLILSSDGGFSYTPTNHFSGVDTFTYEASDGAAHSSPATVSITVSNLIQILSVEVSHDLVTVTWTGIAGKKYRLQFKNNWTDAEWTDLVPDVIASGSTASGTNALDSVSQRFYRVLAPTD